jgi:hypothetical protein
MTSGIKRLVLSSGLTLALGIAFMPLGCGSSGGGLALAFPKHGDVARRLRTCAVNGCMAKLGASRVSPRRTRQSSEPCESSCAKGASTAR